MEIRFKTDNEILDWLEQLFEIQTQIETLRWNDPAFFENGIDVWIRREDQIHPWLQGNKWHKLKSFLIQALKTGKNGLASMGGAYSNHLIAVGYAALRLDIPCTLFIRGTEKEWEQNPVIQKLKEWNSKIIAVDRTAFRNLHQIKVPHIGDFEPHSTNYQWIPMGGTDILSLDSISDWARRLESESGFDHLVIPVASAGTLAGFSLGLSPEKLLAIEVLKGSEYLQKEWGRLITDKNQRPQTEPIWQSGYHGGGYARSSEELISFCRQFQEQNRFQIEPIYSGKAFSAVLDLTKKGHFEEGSRILLVHTGGIFPWTLV